MDFFRKKSAPGEDLNLLPQDQIIKKLSELDWQLTRTGIPGIGKSTLNAAQQKFLDDCVAKNIILAVQKSSILGQSYYCYNPHTLKILCEKPEFKERFGPHIADLEHLIKTVTTLAKKMSPFIKDSPLGKIAIIDESSTRSAEIFELLESTKSDTLKLHHHEIASDNIRQYDLYDSPLGRAILGTCFLGLHPSKGRNLE